MVGSVAGEVIASLGGIVICAPLLYQCQSLIANPIRSPLHAASWYLWTAGFLGLAAFFGHVPSNKTKNHNHKQHPEYVPLSPRALAVFGLLACGLCQLCCSLDLTGPGRRGRQRAIDVSKSLVPGIAVVLSLYYALGFVHKSVVHYNPFYRMVLAAIAFVCTGLSGIGSLLAVLSQSPSQLRRGGPEVAGLYWMPMAMQALGYFMGILVCVLMYTNVEWYGTGVLTTLFVFDLLYIAGSRLKGRRFQKQYSSVAGDDGSSTDLS